MPMSCKNIVEDESIGKREFDYSVQYLKCPESELKDLKPWREDRHKILN